MIDLTPEPEEIVQSEDDDYNLTPIPTTVCGPVGTRELPGIRAGYKTESGVSSTLGVKLLPLEPRRKSAVLMANDQDIWISGSQAGAQAGASGAFRVSAVVPFTIDHMDEVWACAVSGTTDISVMTTLWSE
ncbi:hypothetical protein ABZ208_37520 [Streptomyces sp. NPDC006208]|uniref:hypothetical protein n=1 Tax=Streptomyces sp. NPDC006208 TaxID=3156734 RepID=UPI0033A1F9BE